jgi:hypothetical protein
MVIVDERYKKTLVQMVISLQATMIITVKTNMNIE